VDKKPLIGVSICAVILLVLGSLSSVVGYQTVKSEPSKGNLLDNVPIECHGIYPIDIPLSLLNLPVYYVRIEFSNNNDVPIDVVEVFKLETRTGKVLFEYTLVEPHPIPPHYDVQTQMFTRYTWHNTFEYRFGFFDITLDFHIKDDGSHKKLVFHGLVFGFGAVIFNPKGEVIESRQESYNFPGLR
jgi:hypothetical protein